MKTTGDAEVNKDLLTRLQTISKDYANKQHYKSALFWADKAASLSQYHTCDMYHLAQCMYHCQQYERAALLITKRQLHFKHSAFRFLAAKCYTEGKQWQLALDLLEGPPQDVSNNLSKKPDECRSHMKFQNDFVHLKPRLHPLDMIASLHLLKGDVCEAMDVREMAAECYKKMIFCRLIPAIEICPFDNESTSAVVDSMSKTRMFIETDALKADVFCYEAFERLTEHHMLRAEEEQDLLDSLPMKKQCKSAKEQELLQFLFNTKLKKYNKPGEFVVPSSMDNFHENLDIATSLAERHYYNCEFRTSFKISEGVLKVDPYHTQCLPLHVALLVELKESNKLFYLAHKLVSKYPDLPISWYAVGCYYLLQPQKQERCRRYLLKTTLLDKLYGPAWLAYGHSFASQNEHDQAMAAYFTASQLMKGCHLPFLYIGLEYSVTNNTKLAEKFFATALEVSPDDPHVLHEMAVALYTNSNYTAALKYFIKALEQVQVLGNETVIEEWEPLLNNMGHTYRKLKDYPRALDCHRQALVLVPHSADTYSSIGLVYSYLGDYSEAIEYLHKSLGLRRDDVFTSSLLDTVIQRFSEIDQPICGPMEPEGTAPPLSHHAYKDSTLKFSGKKTVFSNLTVSPGNSSDMTMDDDSRLFVEGVSGIQSLGADTPGSTDALVADESGSQTCSTSSTVHSGPRGVRTRSFAAGAIVSTDDDIEMDEYTD